ncbi:MAG: glycosyltransferase [Thermoanaerobaculia bacterium]|nr:glycosyltransferase [Thermoanaerobaculia bacterium]
MPERAVLAVDAAATPFAGADVMHVSWSGRVGGIERQLELLLRTAAGHGALVHRACFLDGRGPIGERLSSAGLARCLTMSSGADPRGLAQLWRLLRRGRQRVVHLHTAALASTLVALLAHRGVTVYTEHMPRVFDRRPRHRLLYALLRRGRARAVALSPGMANAMAACGCAGEIAVVPNACAVPRRDTAPVAAAVVGVVTRLVDPARVDLLIDVVAALRRRGTSCELLVVGDGPARARFEAHAAARLRGDGVRFAGEQDDVVPWLDRMDLYLLTRDVAVDSLAVVEAMARGVPVAALACRGGTAEVVAAAGLLLPDRRVDAAAAAIAALLSSPSARRSLQERGWRLAAEREPATILARLEAIYGAAAEA